MKSFLVDLFGRRFGALLVIARNPINSRGGQARWDCVCDCGVAVTFAGQGLREGRTTSCGCSRLGVAKNKAHPRNKEYVAWRAMRQRCNLPTHVSYANYGGAGICVYSEWDKPGGFDSFYAHVGACPVGGTLDRIDPKLGYVPGNVRWATRSVQARNKRKTIFLEYNGEKLILTDWAARLGVHPNTLRSRVRRHGASIALARSSA